MVGVRRTESDLMLEVSQELQRDSPRHHKSKVRLHLRELQRERLRELDQRHQEDTEGNVARASAIAMLIITTIY